MSTGIKAVIAFWAAIGFIVGTASGIWWLINNFPAMRPFFAGAGIALIVIVYSLFIYVAAED